MESHHTHTHSAASSRRKHSAGRPSGARRVEPGRPRLLPRREGPLPLAQLRPDRRRRRGDLRSASQTRSVSPTLLMVTPLLYIS